MKKFIYLLALSSFSLFGQTDSLIAHYAFNGNCNDTIGNHHGTPSLDGISYTTGINNSSNSALKISELDSGYVNLGNDSAFQFKNEGQYTLSLWLKMADSSSYRAILVKAAEYSNWDYGIIANSGRPYTGRGNMDLYASSYINDGEWHHLVASYNNGHHKLYVNGFLEVDETDRSINESSGNLILGLKGDALTNNYDGDVDELKIFNKALDSIDIVKLYSEKTIANSNEEVEQTDSLIAYYPFNGNCNDTIGNHHGTPSLDGVSYTTGINNSSNSALKISELDSGYVNLGNDSAFQFKNEGQYTISLWLKMANSSSYRAILVKAPEYDHWDYGIITNNGVPYTGKGQMDLYASSYINDGEWHHLVASYNNGHHKLYVNGVLEVDEIDKSINESSGNLILGLKGDALSNNYDGDVDELKIFNKALDVIDIGKLYSEKSIATSNKRVFKKTFKAYPNPAKNFTKVELNSAEGKIEIYNAVGALAKSILVTTPSFTIDLTDLSSGIYTLKHFNVNSISENKLVITK